MIPPILLRFLPHLALAAALVGGAWWLHHTGYSAGLAAGEVRLQAVLAKQAEIAARSRTLALEAIRRETATALALAEKGRQRAANEATAYKRRLEAALRDSPDCQEWAAQPVLCPVPQ